MHTIFKKDLHLSKPSKNVEPKNFPQDLSFQISETAKIRLPKLEIEKFNGDVINWSSFWNQFSSAIHENDSLSEVNKFTYLKSENYKGLLVLSNSVMETFKFQLMLF